MKVVLDTNIFISGWLWGGRPDRVLKLAEVHLITVCASEELLDELQSTLTQDKFISKLQALRVNINDLMSRTRELVEIYPISTIDVPELRDANDNMILGTAIAADADVIVTGDLDLLVLQEYEGFLLLRLGSF
ncbi:putative toxin-antitoxin system toxin component, PIN family [Microcoleus sp. LEGE 07076]|uniref:putative toxin-antitoxin system toxin component, PIN family n=1 Tax=Microcoleus sp. LEGE 07076 TaxID=915322 RepID=UPI00187EF1B5|nr:putative toxin-antitoxin system toxin component, PIN family [Microcoleus sp. LEGE 07076]MBE9186334.1 putative toxin-antitoxin system toxin component, PIN family [Microcoleus sp. LEGE 07076]